MSLKLIRAEDNPAQTENMLEEYETAISSLEPRLRNLFMERISEEHMWLADWDGIFCGLAGYAPQSESDCELIGPYVNPAYRDIRIGRTLVDRVCLDAREQGYLKLIAYIPPTQEIVTFFERCQFHVVQGCQSPQSPICCSKRLK